ncbi:MAG: helix-turn-helix transcriptional regulator [Leptospiraceae bacterium]|nr:helix-turn-helix transcriptional regulator [Leptospiraceae bacterium]MCK6380843.1 helix-turn-helix transcriptional regulator [Leptospiraceae bacterium]
MKDRVKKIIEVSGLTQTEFSERYGIAQSTLSEIVGGRIKKLPVDVMSKLRSELNIDLNWLLTGSGDMYLPVTPLTGKTTAEKHAIIEADRKARFAEEKNIPLREAVEAMKKKPESIELVKLVLKIPTGKYQQLKAILKSFIR